MIKIMLLVISFVLCTQIKGQSLIDPVLERVAKQVIFEEIEEDVACEISYVGVVIMEKTGAVKANVFLKYDSIAKFKDAPDSIMPIDVVSNKLDSDSLSSAMEEAVTEGLFRRMNSELVRVESMSNVSPPDVLNNYGCFATCILTADNPAYSIGVYYVNKHNCPAGRALLSQIARVLIDWISVNRLKHPYLLSTDTQSIKHRDGWIHPAAR